MRLRNQASFGHAPVAKPPGVPGGEPSDGAFDHGPGLFAVGLEVLGPGDGAVGTHQFVCVIGVQSDLAASAGGRAPAAQWASGAGGART